MSDCCSVPVNRQETRSQCRLCGQKARPVRRLTMQQLLKESALTRLADHSYYFCATPTCSIVYFSNEADSYFHKSDAKVRVGLKETEDPVPICYCFGFTEKMILDEIEATGHTMIPDYIKAQVKAGTCACDVKNPSGQCCLGQVTCVVLKGLNVRSLTTKSEELGATPVHDGCGV
ncbi:MAG: copper chaperone Copz family protein [Acidobacteria bacterium]|nr:copper chaperone Copz family protein [Acidobacteriota bacterium]